MRSNQKISEGDESLNDTTAAIPLHSKRTDRIQKKRQEKEKTRKNTSLLDLPIELVIDILGYLRPSDIFIVAKVNKAIRQFTLQHEVKIANEIINLRYNALTKCFPLPVLLSKVDEDAHAALQNPERQELLSIHKKPYQHVIPPDPEKICTCLTCTLAWNHLCVMVDFAHWQDNLDQGEPIPIIPRGKSPLWNRDLITTNGIIAEQTLHSRFWYARLLEEHLRSTVRSIRRHGNNKGNRRKRFRMSDEDAASGTDLFLERSGPPSPDFPFHRDNYYMLEAYLPNRGWNSEQSRWMYMPASQHDQDLKFVKAWDMRKRLLHRPQP